MADCFNHPARDATGACVNCGKMVCLECRTILSGKVYDQACADEVFVKGPAAARATMTPTPSKGISGAWWLLPIFFTWLGGLIAWLVNKDKDPRKAKSLLWWGIGLTFIYGFIGGIILGVLTLLGVGIGFVMPNLGL